MLAQTADLRLCALMSAPQARRQRGGAGGQCPPDFFLAFPRYFFGRSCCFWVEKTLKFAISARKSIRISAKTFFFWRSPAFGRKICDFGQKQPSDFGEDHFFWRSPAFGRKICDFGQKNSAKTFAP